MALLGRPENRLVEDYHGLIYLSLIHILLGIADPTLPVSQLMADNVPGSFQLSQRGADSVLALFADGGKPSDGIVPVLR